MSRSLSSADSLKYKDVGLLPMRRTPPELATNSNRVRPDGGTQGIPGRPPDENPLEPEAIAENASHLETLVHLLNNPALARVYVYICYWGPVSPPDITDALELSKATTYNYVDTLVERGLVERDDSTRPQQLTAPPVAIVDPAHSVYVTPTVLHAIALQEIDEDVAYFVERYGIGKLIAALRGTGLHFAENATQRMVANDIDVQHLEGMMIVYALIPALAMGQQYDPYFDSLFPDVHDQIEIADEVDDKAIAPNRQRPDDE